MPQLRELGFSNYQDYLATQWWKYLKHKYITLNPRAKCYICKKTNTLLLHHVSYENLAREKLGEDVYILCFQCHEDVHFSKFFHAKTPLIKDKLLKRMVVLKYTYFIRKFRLGSTLNAFWECII